MIARINGLSLYYEDRSPQQPESILFLHGFPFDHSMWRHQVEFFSAAYRCIAPDLRGHGRTAEDGEPLPPSQTTIELMADDAAGLLDHLNVRQTVVCGLSMGGYIAFALWRKHSHLISRIVFADTKAAADGPEARAGRYQLAEKVKAGGSPVAADGMLPRLLAPENLNTPLGLEVRRMIESTSPGCIVNTLHALASRQDSTGLLAHISVPCMIVLGEHDVITPLAEADLIYRRAAGARRIDVIPRAGHLSPLENPAAFNAALAEFLRS